MRGRQYEARAAWRPSLTVILLAGAELFVPVLDNVDGRGLLFRAGDRPRQHKAAAVGGDGSPLKRAEEGVWGACQPALKGPA